MTDANEQHEGLHRAIELAVEAKIAEVRLPIPGEVKSYDHSKQKATVQPVIKFKRHNPRTDEEEFYQPDPIPNCPVNFPSTQKHSITFALSSGDPVELRFASRSLDEWLVGGGSSSNPTEPSDPRKNNIFDVIVDPGIRAFVNALGDDRIDDEAMVLFAEKEIHLGNADPNQFVAVAKNVASRISRLEQAFQSHTNNYTQPAIPIAAAPTTPPNNASAVSPNTTVDDVKSSKVKATVETENSGLL